MSETATTEFTIEYFNNEVCEFRKLLGNKKFWDAEEEYRDRAIKALSFVYFNVKTKNDEERQLLVFHFKLIMEEYTRRATMVTMLKIKELARA